MLVSVSRMVNLASVELSGELMQETHQISYWNELDTNLYLVLISIKGVLNFFYQLKTQDTNQYQMKICFKILPVLSSIFLISGSSFTLISHNFLILDNLRNVYLILVLISQLNDNQNLKPIYQI